MEEKLKKQSRIRYIKGLFLRIILACLIFILLFVGKQFSVELADYTTDQVLEDIQDNSIVESIQNKFQGWFSNKEE